MDKSATSTDSKLHFLDYWRIIRIRKTVITAVFLLVLLTTTAVTYVLRKTYMSTATIAVEKDATDITTMLGISRQAAHDPFFIQTEFEKIQSQMVLDPVITKLGLSEKWRKRYGVEGWLKLSETRSILKKLVNVRQARNTSLIEIRAYSEDPQEAADIANAIAESYRDSRKSAMKERSMAGIKALQDKLQDQDTKVKTMQEGVDKLRRELKISDVDPGTGLPGNPVEPETVRYAERNRVDAEMALVQMESLLENLKGKTPEELRRAIPTAYPDQHLNQLLADWMASRQRLVVLAKDYSTDHPEVERLTGLLNEIDKQIDSRISGVLDGLTALTEQHRARVKKMEAEVEDAKARDVDNLEKYRPYFLARRDLENNQKIRDNLIFRIVQETVDMELPKLSMVEITDHAEPGDKPIRPNIPLNIALGVIVGLAIGIGLAFFIEYLDTSVKTIDDVERSLQAPVLGVIPQNVGSLLEEGPESPHAEAYRVLRTNLLFSRKDDRANTLTVVSGGAGEGKSTTIFNLATVFAQSGQRVLVVDSDLRRPSLHKFLGVSNSMGLTNYLLRQNTLEEVIQTTNLSGLHFLPSGKLPSSSMGILNSGQMKEFIHLVKDRYDFVFFDSPPIMGVSDASILASEVDMSLLVVQYRKYPQVMTLRAKQMVEKVGRRLMGVVLNNINISQDSYYYYYSGYYYDYYSKHDDDETGEKKNGKSSSKESKDRAKVELKKKY